MSKTPDDISTQIRATLATTIPALSCEIGTPERKIIDACAEAISEAYIDQYLVGSLMDIDTKSGLELEQFVGIWGFGRLQGNYSSGYVRVTVNTPSTSDTTFPEATSFYTNNNAAGLTLYFSSKQAIVLVSGDTSCDIPIQCVTVGTQGNLPPDSITFMANLVGGSTCTNLTSLTGGVDVETDQELRQRFKDTMMRNVSGTADWYEAICQQNSNVSRVKVFGPINLYQTQIVVPDNAPLALAVNQDVKYAWPGMESIFANLGQADEEYYSPIYDYTYDNSPDGTSPTITRITSGDMTPGDVVDLEFQYTTRCSRNDPLNGITNKVDVFVDGVDPVSVQESTVIPSVRLTTAAGPYSANNFIRVGSSGSPVGGNGTSTGSIFMRLGSTPVVSFPPHLIISGIQYDLGTHYHRLAPNPAVSNQYTLLAGTQQEIAGIEWTSGPVGAAIPGLTYVYNRVPEVINTIIAGAKQITTDVMAHEARRVFVKPCFQIEYSRSFSVSVTNSEIVRRLQNYLQSLPFGAQVKLSNLAMTVQNVIGVVDVKIPTTGVAGTHGVELYADSSSPTPFQTWDQDFKLNDNQVAAYQGFNWKRVATP